MLLDRGANYMRSQFVNLNQSRVQGRALSDSLEDCFSDAFRQYTKTALYRDCRTD